MKKTALLRTWDDLEYQLADLIIAQGVAPDAAITAICASNPDADVDALILAGSSVAAHYPGSMERQNGKVQDLSLQIHKAVLSLVLDQYLLRTAGMPARTCADLKRK